MNNRSAFFNSSTETYKRPLSLHRHIDEVFERTSTRKKHGYLFTGSKEYSYQPNEVVLNSYKILSTKILSAQPSDPLVVLDVGAGDFSFCREITTLYENKIKAYGIAANDNDQPPTNKIPPEYCVYQNAEYLSKVFGESKFDFIFSRLAYIHFFDPVGSIIEAYKTLKIGGILLVDEFLIPGCELYIGTLIHFLKEKGYKIIASHCNLEINAAILDHRQQKAVRNFIIQKTEATQELQLPLLFSHIYRDKVQYKPNHELLHFHNAGHSRISYFYQEGIKKIKEAIQQNDHFKETFNQSSTLASLLSNSAYKTLNIYDQLLLIHAKVHDTTSFEELFQGLEQMSDQVKYIYASYVFTEEQLINTKYLFVSDTQFMNLDAEQQLDVIKLIAVTNIILFGNISTTQKELHDLGLPSTSHELFKSNGFRDSCYENSRILLPKIEEYLEKFSPRLH